MFIAAVLYVARTGLPWRDMPAEFGRWDAVYHRFRRWESRGVWRQLWDHLQRGAFKVAKDLFIDSTIVRAHQHAAGALKKLPL
jgi:transposase